MYNFLIYHNVALLCLAIIKPIVRRLLVEVVGTAADVDIVDVVVEVVVVVS